MTETTPVPPPSPPMFAEPALWLGAAALALLLGDSDSGWLLAAGAVFAAPLRRWEAMALALPGSAAVAADLAAVGLRWDLALAAVAVAVGTVLAVRFRVPADQLGWPRSLLVIPAAGLIVGGGWAPTLDLDSLEPYRAGVVVAAAVAALTVAASGLTAALNARSGTMEGPAPAGGADSGA